ncbi:MAG TPA: type III-B CRISPR module RAMP protein Cmr4 [Pseudomonadota bacterium]|nr:type III-B CRISPR module RAMP protein Cmr4 [Pseudomonadota bacterium]
MTRTKGIAKMKPIGTLLFLYTETPLHAGAGTSLGAVDLPLQRERMSNLPLVQSSGVKGSLREVYRSLDELVKQGILDKAQIPEVTAKNWKELTLATFGPEPPAKPEGNDKEVEDAITHAGALSIGDARLLLLPVRTVFGGWAWATCPLILSRLVRDLECLGQPAPSFYGAAEKTLVPAKSDTDKPPLGLVSPSSRISPNNRLLIEDTEYPVVPEKAVSELAAWLSEHALPKTASYAPFRDRLAAQLAILSDEEFAFLCQHATEVVTRIKIDPQTGTVAKGALWTEESLPSESLLWSLGLVSKDRRPLRRDSKSSNQSTAAGTSDKKPELTSQQMLACLDAVVTEKSRIRLGGDRTIGRGMLSVRLSQGVSP